MVGSVAVQQPALAYVFMGTSARMGAVSLAAAPIILVKRRALAA
jgi:hypothetical protein